MKLLHLLAVMLFPCVIFSQNPFVLNDSTTVLINELHYDNVGGDTLEGIEIAALSGTDLSCYKVYFVNGNNGEYYSTITLDTIMPDSDCGMGFLFYPKSSIQNGSSTQGDGVALYNVCDDTLIQFISYEGIITATNGPFSGSVSTDIGVSQNADPIGSSLQLQGSLDSSFVWLSSVSSFGHINTNQSFCQTKVELSALQFDSSSCVLGENESITLQIKNISYSNTIDSLIVFFQSNDTLLLSDTLSQSVAKGDSLSFVFSEELDLSQVGTYHFKAWSAEDTIVNSDTLTYSIELYNDDSISIQLEEYVVYCHDDDSLLLEAQVSGADYFSWNTADTTQQLLVFPESDTVFQIEAHNLCYSDTAMVVVDYVKPEITFIGIYEGDTLYENENGLVNYTNIDYDSFQSIYLTTVESFQSYNYIIKDSYSPCDSSSDSSIALTYDYGLSSFGCVAIERWIILEVVDTNGCTNIDSTMVVQYGGGDIAENTFQTLCVFPNPSSGVVSIDVQDMEAGEVFAIDVINTLGKVVYNEQSFSKFTHLNKHLDLSHLKKGLYVLKLSSANKMATRRLILH